MITVDEALAHVRERVQPGKIVRCELSKSLGSVLAKPIVARHQSPRFDSSAVDGFAIAWKDSNLGDGPWRYPIIGESRAGRPTSLRIMPGTAVAISTGALVPPGADAIVMKEDARTAEGCLEFEKRPHNGEHIRKRGAEYPAGTTVIEAGAIVTPSIIGTLAALGSSSVYVFAKPRVTIVVTGDEIKPLTAKLASGQIHDANSLALRAALEALGIMQVRILRARDTARSTEIALRKALDASDIVIVSGGVSVGEHDHVRPALERCGVREIFWRVQMKPGKPIYFGEQSHAKRITYVFALPGNPVSAMVTFQLFVRKAVLQWMGLAGDEARTRGVLTQELRKLDRRTEFVRARVSGNHVTPLRERDSHMMSGMAKADALIVFPESAEHLPAGSEVELIPLRWSIY